MDARRRLIKEHVGVRVARVVPSLVAAAFVVVSMAACGGGGSSPTVTPAASPTATSVPLTPTQAPPAAVGEIIWTTSVDAGSNAPGPAVTSFRANAQTIYAVVRVSNLPGGTVLSAEWSYNGVPLESAKSGVVPPANFSAGFVQFHLAKSDGNDWPAGTYSLNVLLNGDIVQVSEIEVVG